MHVLMTANTSWNIHHFRMPVVRSLLEKGYRVTVVAPADDSVSALEMAGCHFRPLAMDARGLSIGRELALMQRLGRIFAKERPDVILGYTIKNNIFGAIAARYCGIPFIPNVTGLGTAFLSGGGLQRIAEFLYRHAFASLAVVFFQNEDDRDLFLARGLVRAEQARLLPGSGIDLQQFPAAAYPRGVNERAPVFLMIARLLRDKGVLEFVEAARILRLVHPGVRFQLLGAVATENRTAIGAPAVAAWQAEGVIEYLGTADDVRPHIAAADCVVLPSYREGAPRTLIEAAAMARPVIATDVPGCRSVVENGVTGLLCAPRNAQSLAGACEQFLALSPAARSAMGAAGRLRMDRIYDVAHVVSAYTQAIDEVMQSPNGWRSLAATI